MTSEVAAQTRQQLPFNQAILSRLGALRAMSFRGVSGLGSDIYVVQFANGSAEWRIGLAQGRHDRKDCAGSAILGHVLNSHAAADQGCRPQAGLREAMRAQLLVFSALMFCATPALAISNEDVRTALEQRFKGDRTGACVAAGVIDGGAIATAYYCADPNSQRLYDEHTAFEIGSVTKTMTAALLAEFIVRSEVALSDPIAKLLMVGTPVPSFNAREITIADIVTHTSGLPAVSATYRPRERQQPLCRRDRTRFARRIGRDPPDARARLEV